MGGYLNFLTYQQDIGTVIQGSYDPVYVTISIAIAVAASYAAFEHTSHLRKTKNKTRRFLFLVIAAITMGGGIWAMHFIGMLAYKLPVHMEYNLVLTALSVLPAILCSAIGLWIINRPNVGIGLISAGAIIMGGGIGLMHFMGMEAMQIHAELYYDPILFGVSIAVAVVLAFGAIVIKLKLPQWLIGNTDAVAALSAIAMGAAVSGMHYTAMQAAYFIPTHAEPVASNLGASTYLLIEVGISAILFIGLSFAAGVANRNFEMATQLRISSEQLGTTIKELEFQQFALDQHAIVSVSDVKGRITHANNKFCEISGYSMEELIGQTHQIVKSKGHSPEFFREMWQTIASGKVWREEIMNVAKDGRNYWVDSTIVPFIDESGKPFKYVSIRTDITKRKQSEAELSRAKEEAEQANKSKSSFLATMSHEIRTPMNGIIGMIELLNKTPTNDEQKHMLGTVRDSAFSLLHIINDILDFSKIEAGKLTIENTPIHIPSLVEGIVETMLPTASANNVRLKSYINPAICPMVLGDQVRIRQILVNLIGNAVKFTQSSKNDQNEVTIMVARLENRTDGRASIYFSITDTGIGMSEDVVNSLFKPFTQGEESTTRRFGGTGLGLSICKQLIDMMGGTIEVESEVGAGTTFNVTLPFELSDTDMSSDLGLDISGVRVLLAVHDPDTRDITHDYLRHFNAEVKTITSPIKVDEGEDINAWPADVIITCSGYDQVIKNHIEPASGGTDVTHHRFINLTEHRDTLRLIKDSSTLYLNASPLLGTALRRTVAIAAGRASPEPQLGYTGDALTSPKEKPSIEQAERNGQLILLAEDNEINQDVIQRQLELLGYAVEITSNGKEALDAWRSGRFGLVLTDCHMPKMDGFELTAAIRAEEADTNVHIPIIAITANALAGESKRCLDSGMDDFLSKPVELSKLRKTLKKWVPNAKGGVAERQPETTEVAHDTEVPVAGGIPIDPNALTKIVGNDPALHHKLLVKFIDPSKETIGQILTAHSDRCAVDIGDLAHKLKSSARVIGANTLADTCAALEEAGNTEDWHSINKLAPKIDGLMGEVETYVQTL